MDRLSKVVFFVVTLFLFVVVVFVSCSGESTVSACIQLPVTSVILLSGVFLQLSFFLFSRTDRFLKSLQADYPPIKLLIKLGKMIHKLKKKKKKGQLSSFYSVLTASLNPPVTEGKTYLQLENKKQPKFLYKADVQTCLEQYQKNLLIFIIFTQWNALNYVS